jgi:hypothetical protein
MRRVRQILKLRREARLGASQMEGFSRLFLEAGDSDRAVRFLAASKRMTKLSEDLRDCARAWLGTTPTPMSFGYAPSSAAHPQWDRKENVA